MRDVGHLTKQPVTGRPSFGGRRQAVVRVSSALLGALAASSAVSWQACLPAPVATSGQAVCLARSFLKEQGTSEWEYSFAAQELGARWVVRYEPASSQVRGGAGILAISTATGDVSTLSVSR